MAQTPATQTANKPAEQSLLRRGLSFLDENLGTNLNERTDRAVAAWNNRNVGSGEHLFIKNDLIQGLGGGFDAFTGTTNISGAAMEQYNNRGLMNTDRAISPYAHQAMDVAQTVVNQHVAAFNTAYTAVNDAAAWTQNRLANMDWKDAGWNAVRIAGGALQAYAGTGIIAAGAAGCATVVGCILGAPAMALGGFMVVNGAADMTMGAINIGRNFMGNKERLGGNLEEIYKGITGSSAEDVPGWVKVADVGAGMVGSFSGLARGGMSLVRGAGSFTKGLTNLITHGGDEIAKFGKSTINGGRQIIAKIAGQAEDLLKNSSEIPARIARNSQAFTDFRANGGLISENPERFNKIANFLGKRYGMNISLDDVADFGKINELTKTMHLNPATATFDVLSHEISHVRFSNAVGKWGTGIKLSNFELNAMEGLGYFNNVRKAIGANKYEPLMSEAQLGAAFSRSAIQGLKSGSEIALNSFNNAARVFGQRYMEQALRFNGLGLSSAKGLF